MKHPFHPAHKLFTPLPSGRRLHSLKARTKKLRHSFFPKAVRLNTPPQYAAGPEWQFLFTHVLQEKMTMHLLVNLVIWHKAAFLKCLLFVLIPSLTSLWLYWNIWFLRLNKLACKWKHIQCIKHLVQEAHSCFNNIASRKVRFKYMPLWNPLAGPHKRINIYLS